jgi:hypothetical protein
MRARRLLLPLLCLALAGPVSIYAQDTDATSAETSPTAADSDELGSLFQETETAVEAPAAEKAPTSSGPSVLEQASKRDLFAFSYSASLSGGAFYGWKSLSGLSDPWDNLEHLYGISMGASISLDIRPTDYFRLHIAQSFSFSKSSLSFSSSLSEIFADYLLAGTVSNRFGLYGVTWGNARLLGVANLPGRTVSASSLADSVTLDPSWDATPTPSIWLKSSLPLGSFNITGLVGMPTNSKAPYLSEAGYGGLAEYTFGSTCLGLSAYYHNNYTPRGAFTIKSSLFGIDYFVDSTLSAPDISKDLTKLYFASSGGAYYRTKSGPDITYIAELRWNGENEVGKGMLVPDALAIGGWASGAAVSWASVGGSPFSMSGEWFHNWNDSSGVLECIVSFDLKNSLKASLGLPLVYGDAGTEYITNPPSEAQGFAAGVGLVITLSL